MEEILRLLWKKRKIIVEGKEKFPRKFNLSFYNFHVLRKKETAHPMYID